MSSLAFNAALFDTDESDFFSNGPIDNKRNDKTRGKTIKRQTSAPSKIDNMRKQLVLQGIDSEHSPLADFNPPDMPNSAGAERNREKRTDNVVQPHASELKNSSDNPVNVESFQSLPDVSSNENYEQPTQYYAPQPILDKKDDLVNKLDYMIHLLEEQREIKTSSATEEVILYSFLGVFIIFVLDSFARAGKYTR